jgi:hypothetical protein
MNYAGPRLFKRFLDGCRSYVEAVAKEAGRRERNEVLSLDSWIQARRSNRQVFIELGSLNYLTVNQCGSSLFFLD